MSSYSPAFHLKIQPNFGSTWRKARINKDRRWFFKGTQFDTARHNQLSPHGPCTTHITHNPKHSRKQHRLYLLSVHSYHIYIISHLTAAATAEQIPTQYNLYMITYIKIISDKSWLQNSKICHTPRGSVCEIPNLYSGRESRHPPLLCTFYTDVLQVI